MAPLLTNAGRAIVTNRLRAGGTEPKFIAIGTGNTAEAATQTALVTEVEARDTGTSSQATTSVPNDTYKVVGVGITAGTARAVVEAGLFDVVTASSGNMFLRGVFSVINLAIGDTLIMTCTWQLT